MASVAWMAAEAMLMFQKLIIVFGSITTKHIVIISIIAWCKYNTVVILHPIPVRFPGYAMGGYLRSADMVRDEHKHAQ